MTSYPKGAPFELHIHMAVSVDDDIALKSLNVHSFTGEVEVWRNTEESLILTAITHAMNSSAFHKELARHGVVIQSGQLRAYSDNINSLLPSEAVKEFGDGDTNQAR